jgi:hypothetical protein
MIMCVCVCVSPCSPTGVLLSKKLSSDDWMIYDLSTDPKGERDTHNEREREREKRNSQ